MLLVSLELSRYFLMLLIRLEGLTPETVITLSSSTTSIMPNIELRIPFMFYHQFRKLELEIFALALPNFFLVTLEYLTTPVEG